MVTIVWVMFFLFLASVYVLVIPFYVGSISQLSHGMQRLCMLAVHIIALWVVFSTIVTISSLSKVG